MDDEVIVLFQAVRGGWIEGWEKFCSWLKYLMF